MTGIKRRTLLSAVAGSIVVSSLSDITAARGDSDAPEVSTKGRPDLQVLNNRPAETEVKVSLAAGSESVRVFRRSLAGRGVPDISTPQSATADVPVSGGSVYTVQVRVNGDVADERKLGLPPGGIPDHMSIFVDVSERRTVILYSEV